MKDLCADNYGPEFFFEEGDDADYLRDHPVSDLADNMALLLDKDQNGDINIHRAVDHLANYVADGTLTQEEATMYEDVIRGALEQPGGDYKDDGSVWVDDIITYLEDNYFYFDW